MQKDNTPQCNNKTPCVIIEQQKRANAHWSYSPLRGEDTDRWRQSSNTAPSFCSNVSPSREQVVEKQSARLSKWWVTESKLPLTSQVNKTYRSERLKNPQDLEWILSFSLPPSPSPPNPLSLSIFSFPLCLSTHTHTQTARDRVLTCFPAHFLHLAGPYYDSSTRGKALSGGRSFDSPPRCPRILKPWGGWQNDKGSLREI